MPDRAFKAQIEEKPSASARESEGAFAPRGFDVRTLETEEHVEEGGAGDLLDAYFEMKARRATALQARAWGQDPPRPPGWSEWEIAATGLAGSQVTMPVVAPIQRKITKGPIDYPTTWKQISKKLGTAALTDAEAVMGEVRAQLESPIDEVKLEQAWNKVAKRQPSFDIDANRADLVAAIKRRYEGSIKAKRAYGVRARETQSLTTGLQEEDPHFTFVPSARNPMLQRDDMASIPFDADTPGVERTATHASTVVLAQHGKGQEAQASLSRDRTGMALSTNVNAVNEALRLQLHVAGDLRQMAAELLQQRKIATLSLRQAMDDVVIRHSLKLYQRLSRYIAADAPITIPPPVAVELDGVHAEIRIEQSEHWSVDTHFPPSGTKYPCMGCYLYFSGQKIELGHWHGPLWVTNAALSQQLKALLEQGLVIGKLGASRAQQASQDLLKAYQQLPPEARMGRGITKAGKTTIDRRADSESELEEEEFADLVKRVEARASGNPLSPIDDGPESSSEDDDASTAEPSAKRKRTSSAKPTGLPEPTLSGLLLDHLEDYGNVIDDGDILTIDHVTYTVGAVVDNGDCMYATLIALGATTGSVQNLRETIAEYEDAGDAFGDAAHTAGVRAHAYGTVDEDLTAFAELCGGIFVVHVFGHGATGGELARQTVGSSGPTYHILLQGAHFRPLAPS